MSEPDFSGIEPLRLPEARRRVAEITGYLQLHSPTISDADHRAAQLGLSRFQFYRLVRVWREHRKPSLLVIGRRGKSNRNYGLTERAVEIAHEEIASAGAGAELATVALAVEARCSAEGVAPPSRPTIWAYIRKARAAVVALDGPLRILVGRFWFHLPVMDAPSGSMPMLLGAVLLPERIIIAHEVSTDPDQPPSIATLVETLAALRTPGAAKRTLLLDPNDRRAASSVLAAAGLGHVASHPRSVQRELSRAFGDQLGPLKVIYRRGAAKPATRRVSTRLDQPLQESDALSVIAEAVDSSNVLSPVETPAFDIADR